MFYFNMRPSSKLSDSERLQLYDAILDYSQTGEVPEFSGTLGVVWDYIQPTLDEDNARYEATREKRAKAGALGGSAKARNAERDGSDLANLANASDGKQEEAEEANLTNLANSIQSNSIQSNSVQFNSVTGDRAAKPPAHTVFSSFCSGDRRLLHGKGLFAGCGALCGLLCLRRLEGGEESHEGLAGGSPDLGEEGHPQAGAGELRLCSGPCGRPLDNCHAEAAGGGPCLMQPAE